MNSDSSNPFDNHVSAWLEYVESPGGKLRHTLVWHHLHTHLATLQLSRPLTILDVGGGTGELALDLAREGHHVTLLDVSSAMLAQARERCRELATRIEFVCADASEIGSRFGAASFDVVACHSLLEFVSESAAFIAQLTQVLRAGGLLSIVFGNRYHAPMREAIGQKDFRRAHLGLQKDLAGIDLFGLARRTFYPDAVRADLEANGLRILGEYGIRVFADLVGATDNADALLDLELDAGAQLPYRRIARFIHLVAEKI
jgi:S-adenosylmethionine-dependent methyltransferase